MRINSISKNVLDLLRQEIKCKYEQTKEKELIVSSFKGRYNALTSEMQQSIEVYANEKSSSSKVVDAHISQNLLRNLFCETKGKGRFNIAFLNACSIYISGKKYETFITNKLITKNNTQEKKDINPSEYILTSTLAGVVIGFLLFVFVITFKGLVGWQNIFSINIFVSRIFVSFIFTNVLSAYLIALMAIKLYNNKMPKSEQVLTLVACFILLCIFRQIGARDALVIPGALAVDNSTNGAYGGPLAEPDFEMIAAVSSYMLAMLVFIKLLSEKLLISWKQTITIAIKSAMIAGLSFALQHLLYLMLFQSGNFESTYFISPAVFNYKFPHPERLPILVIFVFISILTISYMLRWRFRNSSYNLKS